MNALAVALPLAAFVLLCPIFFTIYLYTDLREKKCWFAFYVLRVIKLHGGYAQPYRGGIAFHLTNKKAVLLPYAEMRGADRKFRILRGFRMLAYSQVFEIGSKEEAATAIAAAALVQCGSAVAGCVLRTKKKCRSFKADILLHEGKDVLKVSQRVILVFNLLFLMLAAGKLLLRKIMERFSQYEKIRKKQKSQ